MAGLFPAGFFPAGFYLPLFSPPVFFPAGLFPASFPRLVISPPVYSPLGLFPAGYLPRQSFPRRYFPRNFFIKQRSQLIANNWAAHNQHLHPTQPASASHTTSTCIPHNQLMQFLQLQRLRPPHLWDFSNYGTSLTLISGTAVILLGGTVMREGEKGGGGLWGVFLWTSRLKGRG